MPARRAANARRTYVKLAVDVVLLENTKPG